jgi:arylsulfatase A-like enzyme
MTIRDEVLNTWPRTPEDIQNHLADYYGLITHMDAQIGRIIGTLQKNGLYENTIIIFSSDHGLAIGSHGLLGKQNLYEHSLKAPLIISGPGIPENEVKDALVYLYDLFPTLGDLLEVTVPEGVEGKSLLPVIMGEQKDVRNSLFTVYADVQRAVKNHRWKLIRYPKIGFTQLFDLKNDPYELNNLAEEAGYEAKTEEMMQLLQEWQTQTGDTLALTAENVEPREFDPSGFERQPDQHQPPYVLEKYFNEK